MLCRVHKSTEQLGPRFSILRSSSHCKRDKGTHNGKMSALGCIEWKLGTFFLDMRSTNVLCDPGMSTAFS